MTDMSVTKHAVIKKNKDTSPKDRRTALLLAAAKVITEKGFHESKISDIVAEAGVAQGTFYLYFESKTDVLRSLVENCCQETIAKLDKASEVKVRLTNASELRKHNIAFLEDLFHSLETKHQVVKFILAGSEGIDPAIDKLLTGFKSALVQKVKDDLLKCVETGCLRKMDTTIVAEAIIGMIYHLAFERFVRGRRLGINIRKLAEEIVDFELKGIVAEPVERRTDG